jgi:diguanylate cyclase (GGDEF)-like protein
VERRLSAEVARARRYRRPLAVVAFDVDSLRTLNELAGREAGDHALSEVAGLARATMRAEALLAHLGAGSFVAVLPESGAEDAERVAARVIGVISESPLIVGRCVTLSAGVSELLPGLTAPELLDRAGAALAVAKQQGRSRVWRYADRP